jgi:hypothetical protein
VRTTEFSVVTLIPALLLLVQIAVAADESGPTQSQPKQDTRVRDGSQPPKSSRLRFRSGGPVCMCSTGLSEAEIEAAERKRIKNTADR